MLMVDASNPPPKKPSRANAIAGYIGGDTPHVWTVAQWNAIGRCRKLPIYVRSNPAQHNPVDDALEALRMLYVLKVPRGSAVALDLETAVDEVYVSGFVSVLHFYGYRVWVYGSLSTVFHNPPGNGYWVAHYDNKVTMPRHAHVVAKQYASGTQFDWSSVKLAPFFYQLKVW